MTPPLGAVRFHIDIEGKGGYLTQRQPLVVTSLYGLVCKPEALEVLNEVFEQLDARR
jgi:hypothetical protein